MNVQSDLVLAASTPDEVANVDVESIFASDMSQNCSISEPAPAEHCEACESVQIQPAVLPDVKEDSYPGTEEISLPNTTITERSEVEDADIASVNVQLSVAVSPPLTESEQLALLRDSVTSLHSSNDELRHIVSDGMLKVTELETAYTKSVARNKELEEELARVRGANERMVSDIALLSTSVAQLSARVDKQAEVKESQPDGSDNAASSEGAGADTSSSQPTIDQRVGELELKLGQSMTRFGEFASALDSIERDLQRYIRRHSLVVENLCPKEDRSASDAFLVFVNSVLGVKVDESDIDGIHLVDRTNEQSAAATNSPDKKDGRPRPILITFTCYRTRTQVYKAWLCHRVGAAGGGKAAAGSLSGERGHGVCIREYLTPSQESIYRNADEMRHKSPDVIADCWTFRGRTFVRTCQGEVCEFNNTDQFCSKSTKTSSCIVM